MELLEREMKCELCGEGFTCKRWFGCWCSKAQPSKERRAQLKLLARDCVCPGCLKGPET